MQFLDERKKKYNDGEFPATTKWKNLFEPADFTGWGQ
jgi:hypothetical protein